MFKGHPKGLYALALANTGERYGNLAKFAFFWTADDTSEDIPAGEARVWYLTNKSMAFGYTAKSKKFAFSLRCVK